MNIGRNIARLLKRKGMSPAEFSRLMDVTKSTVHAWITGKSVPRLSRLPAIASHLDATVSDIIGGSKPKRKSS